jgi:hypothetical protein
MSEAVENLIKQASTPREATLSAYVAEWIKTDVPKVHGVPIATLTLEVRPNGFDVVIELQDGEEWINATRELSGKEDDLQPITHLMKEAALEVSFAEGSVHRPSSARFGGTGSERSAVFSFGATVHPYGLHPTATLTLASDHLTFRFVFRELS